MAATKPLHLGLTTKQRKRLRRCTFTRRGLVWEGRDKDGVLLSVGQSEAEARCLAGEALAQGRERRRAAS